MFEYETIWDIYKVKFLIFFISIALAIVLGNYLYKHNKDKKQDKDD